MNNAQFTPFLRRVLQFDAVTCVLMGILLLAAGGALEQLLAIPAALSRAAGVVLLVFAAAVGYVGTHDELLRRAVWAIAGLNILWTVGSIFALVVGWLEPNALGQAFVVAQAVAVAVLAELEVVGLQRARSVAV